MDGTIRPMVFADLRNRVLATSLGIKPVSSITRRTRSLFSGSTFAVPFITRDTVAAETPANSATSRILIISNFPSFAEKLVPDHVYSH